MAQGKKQKKPYVPIFPEWLIYTQSLSHEEKGRLIDALVMYANGDDYTPMIKGGERIMLGVFLDSVDKSLKLQGVRADSGRIGGIKSGEVRQEKAKQNEAKRSKTKQNEANRTEGEGEGEGEGKGEGEGREPAPPARGFTPPTVDEVAAFAKAEGHPEFDAKRFVEYYTRAGWKSTQGNPVTDWRAKALEWIDRDAKGPPALTANKPANPALDYQQRDDSTYENFNGWVNQ